MLPLAHIDLIGIIKNADNPQPLRSKVVLQDVMVLAVDTEDRQALDRTSLVLTIALKPAECEIVNWLQHWGTPVGVAVRPSNNSKKVTTPGYRGPEKN
jgi:Flp pilus assembly protein CpaB